jgi:hypothetical protein
MRTGTTTSFNTALGAGGDVLFNSGANACGGYAGTVVIDSTHCADNEGASIQISAAPQAYH